MKKGKTPENGDEEDKALWKRVAGTVRPYGKKPAKEAAPPPPPNRKPHKDAPPPLPPAAKSGGKPAFDRGWEEQLSRKGAEVEAKLDLHGMSQTEAYAALYRFIRAQQAAGRRTLLVITGKGRAGGGVLRRLLPLWLEEAPLRDAVVAFTPARPKDGGAGAFYVRLRKKKKG